jgi:hypothetical protein
MNDAEVGEDGLPKTPEPEVIEPGKIFPYDVAPIEMPKGGIDLDKTIAQTKEFIELILPKVLQGVVDTTDSGYQLALAARLGRIAFDPSVSNIRRAEAKRVGMESRYIDEEIGETVYAWGEPPAKPGRRGGAKAGVVGIGPDDLKGVHTYEAHLNPETKADELVQIRAHGEMVQNKFESLSEAREALGKNNEEVERAILIEETMSKPEVRALLDKRIMEKLGLAEQQAVDRGNAALGMPPEAGSALGGMGQVVEPGMGMPLQPGGPGEPAMPQTTGLPASIPGAPGGAPPLAQTVPPLEGMAA